MLIKIIANILEITGRINVQSIVFPILPNPASDICIFDLSPSCLPTSITCTLLRISLLVPSSVDPAVVGCDISRDVWLPSSLSILPRAERGAPCIEMLLLLLDSSSSASLFHRCSPQYLSCCGFGRARGEYRCVNSRYCPRPGRNRSFWFC